MRRYFIYGVVILSVVLLFVVWWRPYLGWLALVLLPLFVLGFIDFFNKTDNIRRTYPLFGRVSRLLENQRHVIQELLLLDRTEGKPFNWIQKEIVYRRAIGVNMTQPFGTQLSYTEVGKEWFSHSAFPAKKVEDDFRVTIGSSFCKQTYSCSILNVSGMSFGSISKNATLALNGGAKIGGFAQNTGEGGLTPYHQKYEADLIFQFGTGYFGCRNKDGNFDERKFQSIAENKLVKMIEVKISQGAKPGFGAILPAKKNTQEISDYRQIKAHTEIHSPANHSAFSNPAELVKFIELLRTLSHGKPIGIKLCIGSKADFEQIIATFSSMNSYPDFITVDGAEGGSGAANMDSLHWVGIPLHEALHMAHQTLKDHNLRSEIKIIASGKIISSFDIAKALALGADACYSARGMMFALGCVQSLKCNLNTCPTGVTTMDPQRVSSLVVEDKKIKVANFHKNTLLGFKELLASSGLTNKNQLSKKLIMKRVNEKEIQTYNELYL